MGYTSYVTLVATKEAGDDLLKAIEESSEVQELFSQADHETDEGTNAHRWDWSDIKWYPEDDDMPEIDFVMNKIEENKNEMLLRCVGEDDSAVNDATWYAGRYWDNPFNMGCEQRITFIREDDPLQQAFDRACMFWGEDTAREMLEKLNNRLDEKEEEGISPK